MIITALGEINGQNLTLSNNGSIRKSISRGAFWFYFQCVRMSCVYCSGTFDDVIMMSSLQGRPMEFVDVDDNNKQWVNDFSSKQISVPHRLENMES